MQRFLAVLTTLMALGVSIWTGPAAAEPTRVTVGTYVNQINGLNLKENQLSADFYIWFRWQGDKVNPIESFELMNGRIEEKQVLDQKMIGDVNYAQARVIATINKFWDVRRFPLDRQDIALEVEDSVWTTQDLVYVSDTENTGFNRTMRIPGYDLGESKGDTQVRLYQTNYGDTSLPTGNKSEYSRYVHSLSIDRPDSSYFWKLFSTIFISALVAFLAFLVKPTDLDPRFGLGVGALFAVVASTFVISSELPESNAFTLPDQINIVALGMIFLSLIQSAVSLKLYERDAAISARLDRASLIVFPIVFAVLCYLVMIE